MLPGMTGLEVCRALRDTHPLLPIVMLSALGDEDDRVAGLELGRRRLRHQAVQRPRAGAAGGLGPAPGDRAALDDRRSSTATSSSTRPPGGPPRRRGRWRSPGGSSTCSRSCSPTPATPTPGPSSWPRSGAGSSGTSRRSPCTSGGCARRSSPTPPVRVGSPPSGAPATDMTPGPRMLAELLQAAPLALLFSLPVGAARRPAAGAAAASVAHRDDGRARPRPAGGGVGRGARGERVHVHPAAGRHGCGVPGVGAVTVPAGLLLGRRVAHEAMWQREALEAERRAEDARRRLVAGMSHDLRSPLAGICGMADALVDGVVRDPDEVRDYLARIRREASRMTVMVGDLFQLARATSGTLQLTLEPLALAEAASDAVAADRRRPGGRGRGRRARGLADGAGQRHRPHPRAAQRALQRCAAHRLRRDGAAVGGARGATAWLRVDDGCGGIPETDLPLIFDIGYRGSGARTPLSTSGRASGCRSPGG